MIKIRIILITGIILVMILHSIIGNIIQYIRGDIMYQRLTLAYWLNLINLIKKKHNTDITWLIIPYETQVLTNM